MSQIFVSYAHEDNTTPDENLKGWVTYFYLALEYELNQRITGTRLWRDAREIRPYEQFSEDIEEGLKKSKILLSVLSPIYIDKKWCCYELSRFAELSGSGDRANRERIFKIIKRGIDRELEPEPLQGQTGYQFYEFDPETKDERPYYHPAKGAEHRYWDVMGSLASDLVDCLKNELDPTPADPTDTEATTQTSEEATDTESPAKTAFLAFATADLADDVRAIRGELEALGVRVLPDAQQVPLTAQELETLLTRDLKNVDFSIHILGATAGFTPDGANAPMVELQLEAAKKAKVKRVVWMPDNAERHPLQAGIIAGLRSGENMMATDELIEEGFDRFKGYLVGLAKDGDQPGSAGIATDLLLRSLAAMSEEERARFRALLESG